jgi:hypothetical protein
VPTVHELYELWAADEPRQALTRSLEPRDAMAEKIGTTVYAWTSST